MTLISLQPASRAEERVPLDQQISRVTREHGSFADLNEQAIEHSIKEKAEDSVGATEPDQVAGDDDGDRMDVDGDEGAEVDGNSAADEVAGLTATQIGEMRRELAARLGTALNEAMLNLDFTSLLITGPRPQAGSSSLSPMLRTQVPAGSLNAANVAVAAPPAESTAGYGWKLRQFEQSAISLAAAATRLAVEAGLENTFWHGVLGAAAAGEVVNRKLHIRYGFRDAGSAFPDRGVGHIERTRLTGEPRFVPGVPHAEQRVVVSVYAKSVEAVTPSEEDESERFNREMHNNLRDSDVRRGAGDGAGTEVGDDILVGRAAVDQEFALAAADPLLGSIRRARSTLFELELMQQIIAEARRGLGSHRVRLVGGRTIVCEIFTGRIEIALVDAADALTAQPGAAFGVADAISYSLQLLLVQQFHKRFLAAHKVPEPLNSKATPADAANTDDGLVLEPVLAHIQHGVLLARVIKLVGVLLPRAEIVASPPAARLLGDAPGCTLSIILPGRSLELEVRSPITKGTEPVLICTKRGQSTHIFDLTELEVWLKWAAK